MVHGGVGVLEQRLRVHAVVRKQRDTETRADADLAAVDAEGRGQRFQDAPGRLHHVGRIHDAGEQDRELVAARPGNRGPGFALFRPCDEVARAQAPLQPFRHALQQEIAGIVSQGVVDDLEIVEIHEQDRDRAALLARLLQCRVQALLEHDAVGQLGQAVEVREEPDSLFEVLVLGDVAHDHEDFVVRADRHARLEIQKPAVALLDIMKQLRLPGRQRPVDVFEQGVADLAGHDFADMPSNQTLGFEGRRKIVRDFVVQADTVAAQAQHHVRYRFDKRAVLPLAAAQLVHGLVGAPLEAHEGAGQVADLIADRNRQRFDCESPLGRCQPIGVRAIIG